MKLSFYAMALILLTSTTPVYASKHILKWGINVEPIIYFHKASQEFKKRIEHRSNGRIEVQLFKNVVPQKGHDHLGDVKKGTYHMAQETVFVLQKIIPKMAIWSLPYLFRNDKHVEDYMNSQNAQNQMKKLSNHGVIGLGYTYSGGFLHVYGNKIQSFSELQGSSLGLEESIEAYKAELKNWKITISDFNSNLPTKTSEIIASTGREIYEMGRTSPIVWNVTDHRVISRVLFISKRFIESLPKDLQKIVLEEGKRVAKLERDPSIRDKYVVLKELPTHKIKINRWSEEQKQTEKGKFKNLYMDYVNQFGSMDISFIENL